MNNSEYKNKLDVFIVILIGLILIGFITYFPKVVAILDGDNAPQTFSLYSFSAKSVINGEMPLWTPNIWSGISNVGTPITESFYPINWLLGVLFWNRSLGFVSYGMISANIFIHLSLYFLGMFFLLKKRNVSTLVAGLLSVSSIMCFSFARYCLHGSWYSYMDAVCWYPLIIFFGLKLIETDNNKKKYFVVILGFLFAIEATISVGPTLVFIAITMVIMFALYGIYNSKIKNSLFKIIASGILAIILVTPILISVASFAQKCARYIDDLGGWLYGSAKIPFANFNEQVININDIKAMVNFQPQVSCTSFAVIIFLLALIGIAVKNKEKDYFHLWEIIFMLYSVLYCIGVLIPDIVYYIPFLNSMREPYMYGIFANIYLTLLASDAYVQLKYNLSNVDEKQCLKDRIKLIWNNLSCNIGGLKIILSICILIIISNILPVNYQGKLKLIYSIILFGIIISYFVGRKKLCFLCFLVVNVIGGVMFIRTLNEVNTYREIDAINIVDKVNEYDRDVVKKYFDKISKYQSVGTQALPENFGNVVGYRDALGYFNPTTEIAAKSNDNLDIRVKSKLQNIKYFLVKDDNAELKQWFENAYNVKYVDCLELYTSYNNHNLEKVDIYEAGEDMQGGLGWISYQWDAINYEDDESQVLQYLNSVEDICKTALIDTASIKGKMPESENVSENAKYKIECPTFKNNRIEYTVTTEKAGVFVTTEMYDNGWEVYINGKKANLLRVNYSNRGAYVEKGENKIEFVYRPKSFYYSFICSTFIIVIFIVFSILKKRYRKLEVYYEK